MFEYKAVKKMKKYAFPKRFLSGMSLIEMMLALLIFSLLMTVFFGIFSRSYINFSKFFNVQRNLESTQTALDLMAKNLRSSYVAPILDCNPNTNPLLCSKLRIFDLSTDSCIQYEFSENKLKMASMVIAGDYEVDVKREICQNEVQLGQPNYPLVNIFAERVEGRFYVEPTVSGNNVDVGRVTVSMKVCPESGCINTPLAIHLQTTVSLRNY